MFLTFRHRFGLRASWCGVRIGAAKLHRPFTTIRWASFASSIVRDWSSPYYTLSLQIAKADKEMQFHLGHDDTALENLMRRLCSARCPSRSQSSTGAEKSSSSNRTQENDYDDCGNGGDMTRTTFKGVSVPHGGGPLASAPAHAGRQGSGALSDARAAPLRLGRFLRQVRRVWDKREAHCDSFARRTRSGSNAVRVRFTILS